MFGQTIYYFVVSLLFGCLSIIRVNK